MALNSSRNDDKPNDRQKFYKFRTPPWKETYRKVGLVFCVVPQLYLLNECAECIGIQTLLCVYTAYFECGRTQCVHCILWVWSHSVPLHCVFWLWSHSVFLHCVFRVWSHSVSLYCVFWVWSHSVSLHRMFWVWSHSESLHCIFWVQLLRSSHNHWREHT